MAEAGASDAPGTGEFALIAGYFSQLTPGGEGVALGIGDDAALLNVSPGQHLVVTSDTLIAGRHFPPKTAPFDIGWKALAVNLSDLAAMGARPRWFTLALSLPQADPAWLADFAAGLKALADRHQVALIGGDTTRGALSLTITALGEVPAGSALRRDGARPGDLICVTGTLGDAALALAAGEHADPALAQRLNRPQPRVEAGLALRSLASAAIDLSDGLAGDLAHILAACGVGADVQTDALPMSAAFARLAPHASRLAYQAAGGDDYELCICVPPEALAAAQTAMRAALQASPQEDDVPLTVIGRIAAERGLRWWGPDGARLELNARAYQHF